MKENIDRFGQYLLLKSYLVRYRKGWEEGPTENEVMEEVLDWLWNHNLDPSCHKENVNQLIEEFEGKKKPK